MNVLDNKDVIEKVKNHKYETRKYHTIARHLELLAINSDLDKIKELEDNEYIKPYIKYIGGIGGSRALEFCVSKPCIENKAIDTIEYILDKLKKEKRTVPEATATHMLNTALIYHKYEVIDYLIATPIIAKKFNFTHGNYLVIKNLLRKDDKDTEKYLLKKLLVEKVIILNKEYRYLIEKSQNKNIVKAIEKIDLKEKIENKLLPREEIKIKKNKI